MKNCDTCGELFSVFLMEGVRSVNPGHGVNYTCNACLHELLNKLYCKLRYCVCIEASDGTVATLYANTMKDAYEFLTMLAEETKISCAPDDIDIWKMIYDMDTDEILHDVDPVGNIYWAKEAHNLVLLSLT